MGVRASKTFLTWLFLFSGVLDGNAEGRESTKPGSFISAKRRGEAKGKVQNLQQYSKPMIHSPTKAENKVMVAIKEVNENELPENGTTPSVCLHVSSIRSISLSELLLYVYM